MDIRKTLIFAVAAVASAAHAIETNGLVRLSPATSTEAEYRAVFQAALTAKGQSEFNAFASRFGLWTISSSKLPNMAALVEEFDGELERRGFGSGPFCIKTWPKSSVKTRIDSGYGRSFPKLFALAEKYGCDAYPLQLRNRGATFEDFVEILDERIAYGAETGQWRFIDMYGLFENMRFTATKVVKRWLRRHGKSFVTKDGVNPCAEYIDALTASLNAPRLEGFAKWLSDMDVGKSVDLSKLPPQSEIEALKEKILDGDKEIDFDSKAIMTICLGVDGYNAFVKEFNGDK